MRYTTKEDIRLNKKTMILWVIAFLFFITSFSFIKTGQFVELLTGFVIAAALGYAGYRSRTDGTIKKTVEKESIHATTDSSSVSASVAVTESVETAVIEAKIPEPEHIVVASPDAVKPVETAAVAVEAKSPESKPEYSYKAIKVAGVTFRNGRKSRQAILRKIKFEDDEFAHRLNVSIREYEYEGKPAFGIYANDQQIGNIPADMCGWMDENFHRVVEISDIDVYGGGYTDDGDRKKFGATITIKYVS